jgi:hypothetical protein
MKYPPPSMVKKIQNTIHPRTLKEFSQSGSAPVQGINSGQREPLHMHVRTCLTKLKSND